MKQVEGDRISKIVNLSVVEENIKLKTIPCEKPKDLNLDEYKSKVINQEYQIDNLDNVELMRYVDNGKLTRNMLQSNVNNVKIPEPIALSALD